MNNVSPFPTGLKYGLILALLSILLTVILYVADLLTNPSISMISGLLYMIIFIVVTVLAIRSYKTEQRNGQLTLGKGFLVGIITSLVASIIVMIFTYILYAFIDPDLLEAQMEMTQEMMENMGFMSEDQIEEAMDSARANATPFKTALNQLGLVCCGGVVSLITALVLKNDNLTNNSL